MGSDRIGKPSPSTRFSALIKFRTRELLEAWVREFALCPLVVRGLLWDRLPGAALVSTVPML
ncbi:MAG: hypothetical protein OHK0037_08770 [Elainellaceae cyanobacterium]